MSKSWQKRIIVLLITLLVAALIFFAWTAVSFTTQSRKTALSENENAAHLWSNHVDDRMDAMFNLVYELLLNLHNNTELAFDTPMMGALTKRKIVDLMDDQLLISSDADAFFVLDVQDDLYLFSASQLRIEPLKIIRAKSYWHDHALDRTTSLSDRSWHIVHIGDDDYFAKAVKLGKYVVGVMSNTGKYSIEDSVGIVGSDVSCYVRTEDALSCLSGDAQRYRKTDELPAVSATRGETIITVAASDRLNGAFIVTARAPRSSTGPQAGILMLISGFTLFLVVQLLLVLRNDVVRPTEQLMEANKQVSLGNVDYRLDDASATSEEFERIFQSFNEMAEKIGQLERTAYEMGLQQEEDRLTMLRAQIKPHSFLNSITTVSNMTYTSSPEKIREYIGSLAKFIRYMLHADSSWTTLGEEAEHIRNYIAMQQFRSPTPITFRCDIPEEDRQVRIPFLILYTLVENSIKHALTLTSPSFIRIASETVTEDGCPGIRIIEEDNGSGFSEEALSNLLDSALDSPFVKEHLGLTNVRYTLNLLYHRDDLLRVRNLEKGGAHVELFIPLEEM